MHSFTVLYPTFLRHSILNVHNASGVVLKDNENGKVLEPHALCLVMHLKGLSHHEGTDAYIKWQNNNRYALHSAAMTVTSSSGCPALGAPRICPPDKESGPAVCELAGEPILARMGCV